MPAVKIFSLIKLYSVEVKHSNLSVSQRAIDELIWLWLSKELDSQPALHKDIICTDYIVAVADDNNDLRIKKTFSFK